MENCDTSLKDCEDFEVQATSLGLGECVDSQECYCPKQEKVRKGPDITGLSSGQGGSSHFRLSKRLKLYRETETLSVDSLVFWDIF